MAILYQKKGRITVVTLNRPEAFNAIDPETLQELSHAFIDFSEDHEAWVMILTGAGDKAFCAGADIRKLLPVMEQDWVPHPWKIPPQIARGLDVWKPIIAAVNGMALGGGCELALGSDIRIASENASFGVPEVKLGLLAGLGWNQSAGTDAAPCEGGRGYLHWPAYIGAGSTALGAGQ